MTRPVIGALAVVLALLPAMHFLRLLIVRAAS